MWLGRGLEEEACLVMPFVAEKALGCAWDVICASWVSFWPPRPQVLNSFGWFV